MKHVKKRMLVPAIILGILVCISGCQNHSAGETGSAGSGASAPDAQASAETFMSEQMDAVLAYWRENETIRAPFSPLERTEYRNMGSMRIPLSLIQTVQACLYENRMEEFVALNLFQGEGRARVLELCPDFEKLTGRSLEGYTGEPGWETIHFMNMDGDEDTELVLLIKQPETDEDFLIILNEDDSDAWRQEAKLPLAWSGANFGGICRYGEELCIISVYDHGVNLFQLCYGSPRGPEAAGPYYLEAVTVGTALEDMDSRAVYEDAGAPGYGDVSQYMEQHLTDILSLGTTMGNRSSMEFSGIESFDGGQALSDWREDYPHDNLYRVDYDDDGIEEALIEHVEGISGPYILNGRPVDAGEPKPLPRLSLEDALILPPEEYPIFSWEPLPLDELINRKVWFQELNGRTYMFRLYEFDSSSPYSYLSRVLFIAGKIEKGSYRYLNITAFTPRTGVYACSGYVVPGYDGQFVKDNFEAMPRDCLTLSNGFSSEQAVKASLDSLPQDDSFRKAGNDQGPLEIPADLRVYLAQKLKDGIATGTFSWEPQTYDFADPNLTLSELGQMVPEVLQYLPEEDGDYEWTGDMKIGYLLDLDGDGKEEILTNGYYIRRRIAYKATGDGWKEMMNVGYEDQTHGFVLQSDDDYYWVDSTAGKEDVLTVYHWSQDVGIRKYSMKLENESYRLIPAYRSEDCTEQELLMLDEYVYGMYEDLMKSGGRQILPDLYDNGYTEELTEEEIIKCRFQGDLPEHMRKADFNNDGISELIEVHLTLTDNYAGSWYDSSTPLSEHVWKLSGHRIEPLSAGWSLLPYEVMPNRVNLWFYKNGGTVYTCTLTSNRDATFGLSILKFEGSLGKVVRSYGIRAKEAFTFSS